MAPLRKTPSWVLKALDLHSAATRARYRITAFRLTDAERTELEALTGQRDMLWGYPVRSRGPRGA